MRNDGTVHELTNSQNMAACTILFPPLWEQIERELGSPVIAAFPHRDFVLYARRKDAEALKRFVEEVDFNETHALSRLLFERADGEWRVVKDS